MIDVIAGVTIDKLDFLYLIYNMPFLIKKRLALLTDTYLDRLYIVVCRYYLSIIFIAVKHLFEDTLYLSTKLLGLYRYHIYNVGLYLSINMGSLCRYIRKIFKDQS